jgi:hypothetical protein
METAEGRTAGRDLTRVRTVIASGGVFRHPPPERLRFMLEPVVTDVGGGWRLPTAPETYVDRDHVLAAAGLLAADHPDAAAALIRTSLLPRG